MNLDHVLNPTGDTMTDAQRADKEAEASKAVKELTELIENLLKDLEENTEKLENMVDDIQFEEEILQFCCPAINLPASGELDNIVATIRAEIDSTCANIRATRQACVEELKASAENKGE